MTSSAPKSASRDTAGRRHASSSHQAVTKVTTTTPPVMCTENTSINATPARECGTSVTAEDELEGRHGQPRGADHVRHRGAASNST